MDIGQIEKVDRQQPGHIGIREHGAHLDRDERREIARHDRQHESGEEALDRPGACMVRDRPAIDGLPGSDQQAAEGIAAVARLDQAAVEPQRSEEHTSELQSLMRISYAVFCLKKKKTPRPQINTTNISNTQSTYTHIFRARNKTTTPNKQI